MNISRLWKTDHKLLKSSYLDEVDGVIAGESFKIRYLGRTHVDEGSECRFNETADELLALYSSKSLRNLVQFDLFIDSKSVMICDSNRQCIPVVLVTIPLSDVRDAFYRKRDRRYGNICIFIARDISKRSLKAHVLLCNNPEITAKVFESFQRAFAVLSTTNKRNSAINVSGLGVRKTSFHDLIGSQMAVNKTVNNNLERKPQGMNFRQLETNVYKVKPSKEFDAFSSFAYSRAKVHDTTY